MTERELYKELRRKYGDTTQQGIAIEEMAELTQAIIKGWRDIEKHGYITPPVMDNITEEMADVNIMLRQLTEMYGNGYEIEMTMKEKLLRTEKRLAVEIERSIKWE